MKHRPKKIVIFRHAEKPLDDGNQRLSDTGSHRAQYLADYIPKNFGKPDVIFATEPTKSSFRPLLTVTPLWETMKDSKLDASIADDDAIILGIRLREGLFDHDITDKNVVVCWHHGQLPQLLKGLCVDRKQIPEPWPEKDFSTVLVVTFDGHDTVVSNYKQLF